MKGYIYKIINKENGKFYIGSTINLEKRKKRHFDDLHNKKHHCIFLQRAYDKYGVKAFEFYPKEVSINDEKQLRVLEERYIGYCWNSGKLYNTSKKGSGGDLISYHPNNKEFRELQSKLTKKRYANLSKEDKEKYSEKMKGVGNPNYGNHWTNEMREKMSNYLKEYYSSHECILKGKTYEDIYGKEKADELKRKMSERFKLKIGEKNHFYGKHHSEKTKEIIRQKHLGKKNLVCSKKVLANGVIYDSANDCAKKLSIDYSTVAYRCRKHIYGFSYVGENDNLPQRETKKMWTFEECEKLASECKTIKEFQQKHPQALYHLRNHKEEFEKIKNKYFTYIRTYWTLDKVIELTKKYKSYKEFRENEFAAYSSMKRHNWTNKIKEIYNKK